MNRRDFIKIFMTALGSLAVSRLPKADDDWTFNLGKYDPSTPIQFPDYPLEVSVVNTPCGRVLPKMADVINEPGKFYNVVYRWFRYEPDRVFVDDIEVDPTGVCRFDPSEEINEEFIGSSDFCYISFPFRIPETDSVVE